jgi:urease subunit gamma/beta
MAMHLTARERERLEIAAGADLARRRIARGAQLGASEAIALLCDEVQEMAWDDVSLEQILLRAPASVPRERLLPDVPALVPVVEIEALFPHGTVLVHLTAPFGPPPLDAAGSVRPARERIELAPGRRRAVATLRNRGALPVWVSSHVPLDSLNPSIEVSMVVAGRYRLDQPAGSSIKVEPGQERQVSVVEIVSDRT